jgi:hypothetical protein
MMGAERRAAAIALAIAALMGSAGTAAAAPGDNAVVHWNQVAADTVNADSARRTPSAAALYMGIAQAAVYDAVTAVDGTYAPYLYDGPAAPGASAEAAAATAARDVLAQYFPGSPVDYNGEYAITLGQIPDGPAEAAGVELGHQVAQQLIAARSGDGRDTNVPAPPDGTLPGVWRRTSAGSVVTPYTAHVTPFLAESPEQFRPANGPLPVDSRQYAEEYERTRLYGAKTGSLRSPEQNEIAAFWTENTSYQYNRALRGLARARGLSVTDSARLLAMTLIPAADAMITCWNTKYHYLGWRPMTAIRLGDEDGNRWTTGDPTWEPLSVTGLHPEYTSGHACLTGAITRGLIEFLGTKKIAFSMDSTVTKTTHYYATARELRAEVEDARVFGGDHFETGGEAGTVLGDDLAKWALARYFEAR